MNVIYWLTLRREPWAIWGAREWVDQEARKGLCCEDCQHVDQSRYPEPIHAWIQGIERNRSVGGLCNMRLQLIHVRLLERLKPFMNGFVFGDVYVVEDRYDTKGRLAPSHRTIYTNATIRLRYYPDTIVDICRPGRTRFTRRGCGGLLLAPGDGQGHRKYTLVRELGDRHVWQCTLSRLYVSQTVVDAIDWSEFKDLELKPIPVLDRPLDNLRLPGDPDWEAMPPLSEEERQRVQVLFEGGVLEPPPLPRRPASKPKAPSLEKVRRGLERHKLNRACMDFVMQHLRPGFRLEHTDKTVKPMSTIPLGSSRLGGVPDMPRDWDWPTRPGGPPLAFLCQLDLENAAGIMPLETSLPERGHLYFFYDNTIGEQPWGSKPEDCGGWRVLFSEANAGDLRRTLWPDALPDESRFEVRPVRLKPVLFLPSGETLGDMLPGGIERQEVARWEIGGGAAIVETAAIEPDADDPLAALRTAIADGDYGAWAAKLNGVRESAPDHRFLGHPQEEQSSMPVGFAGLVTERPDREVPDPMHPGSTFFIPGQRADAWPAWARELLGQTPAEDWRLLLQLDSDGWMWGDCGKLYFWVPREALHRRCFDRVWLQLQCG